MILKHMSPQDLYNAMGFPSDYPGECRSEDKLGEFLLKVHAANPPIVIPDLFALEMLEKHGTMDAISLVCDATAAEKEVTPRDAD